MILAVNQIVPRLYDAVGNPTEWNSILEEFVEAFGSFGASIFSGDEIQIELNHVYMSSAIARNIPDIYCAASTRSILIHTSV